MEEEKIGGHAAAGTRVTIRLPDDFHHHCRDGSKTAAILEHASQRFGRLLIMPNLKPPVTTTEKALTYKEHIMSSMPNNKKRKSTDVNGDANGESKISSCEPLMTLYLTDNTTAEEIAKAAKINEDAGRKVIVGCKYYPAGATTNSDHGVTDIKKCYSALEEMQKHDMMLCIHSEVTTKGVDIFDREPEFIENVMKPLVKDFTSLKITMEHISTEEAVNYVMNESPDNVKASITCHHLLYNRNHMLVGGIRPHLYCLPILKAEQHRRALLKAATSGSPKFFLGTDSAPHTTDTKEAACGCAGVFTAHAAIELYAEAFDRVGALDKLEDFCSTFGADHYGIPQSPASSTITLEKKSWTVPLSFDFGDGKQVTPLRAGEEVLWSIVD